jgi:DNA-binding transcriptional regulator YiaG
MKISDALARAARQAEMSDTEIGAAIGVSAQTVSHWRLDRKKPRGPHLIKLIEVLPGFGKLVGLEASAR